MKITKNNMSAATEPKKYVFFPFAIYDAMDEFVGNDMVRFELSDSQLKKVAKVMMEKNGGYPVDMDKLGWLQKIVSDRAYTSDYKRVLDEEDWDAEWYAVFSYDMPEELIEYAEEFVTFKDVSQKSYVNVTGTEESCNFGYRISKNAYNAMKEVLTSKVDDRGDFDLLKEQYPEIYNEVAPDALEQGFKWAMSRYNIETTAYLKEFPVEIYREISCEDVI